MPTLSGRAIGASVVAALVVAGAGWGAGHAASSGGTEGAPGQSLPGSFSPSGDRVEIGSIARRRDLPKLGSVPAPARKSTPAKRKAPAARAPSRTTSRRPVVPPPPVRRPVVPPPPVRPPVIVPPPPAQGTPGGDFSTSGTT